MLSYTENITAILTAAQGYKRVLDIGPGFGKYGLLLREQYLSDKAGINKELIPVDDIVIDCAEITEFFLKRAALKSIYNEVHTQNLFDWTPEELMSYDLVLLIDVTEHYPKDRMQAWLAQCPANVLVSTPKHTHMYQEHYYGDPNHHCSQWTLADFKVKKNFSTPQSHIVIV